MSVPPESPLNALFAGLSAEELIAAEQGHQLDPELSTIPSILGKRAARLEDNNNDDEDGADRSPSPDVENNSPRSHTNVSALQMEQAMRKLRKWLKLSSEDTALIEQFTQVCVLLLLSATHS